MQVSDRLTDIAELIVEQRAAARRGGRSPRIRRADVRRWGAAAAPCSICAVGYGKLGGMELGYGSDLDLVFLHDSHRRAAGDRAARSRIDNQLFFVRLAQRIVHLLTMHSAAGRLYEVDMRLRPSGKGGLLVTTSSAFAEYQRVEAWTWEHQALLHARAVAGDAGAARALRGAAHRGAARHVRRDTLREEVRGMRERMRRELSTARTRQHFDIKQDPGGIADIEFLAQYWALLWAGDIRRWRCSPTPSASSSRWRPPRW